jgi:DNA repair protein RadD
MIQLRPYQVQSIADIRDAYANGKRAPLLVSPTGSGKTTIFAHISAGAASKGNRVLILAHRTELIDQISLALNETETEHGFIAAGYPLRSSNTLIASVQTMVRRLDQIPEPQLVIQDEAHHSLAETFDTILHHWPRAKLLGVTATPVRTSGEGLGRVFDHMVLGPSTAELTRAGYLVPARVFAPPTIDISGLHRRAGEFITSEADAAANRPSVTGSAVAEYRQHSEGKRALVFCVSVKHAHDVAKQFREEGYPALALDGGTDRAVRKQAVADFRAGSIRLLVSADLFSEGFDVPAVEVGILLRPTASLGLYLQQVGRCLRSYPGKTHALIFDHAANCTRFGLPADDREWSLLGEERKKQEKPALAVRVCPNPACFAANNSRAKQCIECGHIFEVKPREIEQRKGVLQEVTPEMVAMRLMRREQGTAQSYEALVEIGRRRGMKYPEGWARHVWAARQAKKPDGENTDGQNSLPLTAT